MSSRGINKVILIGYLGQDPEIKYTTNGNSITTINLATSENWKDKQTGELKEKTEWHKIVFFGKLAEISGEYLKKGSQVYIEGQIQTRKWKDQNGNEKYITEIIVGINGTMQMLGNKTFNKIDNNKNFIRNDISSLSNKDSDIDLNKDINLSDFDEEIPF